MLEKVAEFKLLKQVFGLDGINSYEAGFVEETHNKPDLEQLMPTEKPVLEINLEPIQNTNVEEKKAVNSEEEALKELIIIAEKNGVDKKQLAAGVRGGLQKELEDLTIKEINSIVKDNFGG